MPVPRRTSRSVHAREGGHPGARAGIRWIPAFEGVKRLDRLHRAVLWFAFRCAKAWWFVRRPRHRGALVAVWCDGRVLVVRQSYRRSYPFSFPGGGVKAGEDAGAAAVREMAEEVGVTVRAEQLRLAYQASHRWDFRLGEISIFELHLKQEPELRIDNREIVDARFLSPAAVRALNTSPSIREYMYNAARAARA